MYCGLEADEGSVDLAYGGQRQHDLPPVLRVLLQRVSLQVDRLQGLGVLQLVQVRPVVDLIIVHLEERGEPVSTHEEKQETRLYNQKGSVGEALKTIN